MQPQVLNKRTIVEEELDDAIDGSNVVFEVRSWDATPKPSVSVVEGNAFTKVEFITSLQKASRKIDELADRAAERVARGQLLDFPKPKTKPKTK